MEKEGVLVVGSVNMDLVVTASRFPEPGETIFGKKFQMFPGGKGANQAVCSAKLGMKTSFIGKFGDDQFCKQLRESMQKDGVDLDQIFTDNIESTGTAFIIVTEDGQNEIVVISGSNMKLLPSDITKKEYMFHNYKVVLAQLEIPVESVLRTAKLAKQSGAVFILNPAPARELPDELFSYIDFLTPNEIELELLSGIKISKEESLKKAAYVLLHKGVRNVIITMGSSGAYLINMTEEVKFPARKVKVIDTTAAGDAFNGAFAFSIANGKNLHDAVKFANLVASVSVTRMGAQSSMPVPEEINSFEIA